MFALIYAYGFWVLLPMTCLAAWRWGGEPGVTFTPERTVAALLAVAAVATVALLPSGAEQYRTMERATLAVDGLLLLALTAVALSADRWWPLCIVPLHAASTLAHLGKLLDPRVLPVGYQLLEQASSYPTLAVLAVGIWRHHHRLRRPVMTTSSGSFAPAEAANRSM